MNIKPEWLDITTQQFDIFAIISELNAKKRDSKAKDIIKEYENTYHTKIKRQNLFTQLKTLMGKEFIVRKPDFLYIVNCDQINQLLKRSKERMKQQLNDLDESIKNVTNNFEMLLNLPKVAYLDCNTYMETLSNLIDQSSVLYADSPFPNLSYSQTFYSRLNRKCFIESMKLNCFKLKKLKIYYLTNLVIDLTFRRALRVFQSAAQAYRECRNAIDRFEKQVNIFPNLHVRYLEVLPGPHMYVFENDTAHDVVLSLRESNVPGGITEVKGIRDPYGGIHIMSSDIATAAKNIYINSFRMGLPLKGKRGKILLDRVRANLDKLYEEHKKTN